MGGLCSTHVKDESAYKILIGKSEGKRPCPRPKRRWENNIRMDLKRNWVGRCGLDASSSG